MGLISFLSKILRYFEVNIDFTSDVTIVLLCRFMFFSFSKLLHKTYTIGQSITINQNGGCRGCKPEFPFST